MSATEHGLAHSAGEPSPWVLRWSHLVPAGARLLDLACGGGRHARYFASLGVNVTALDRDAQALAGLRDVCVTVLADLEDGAQPLPRQLLPGSWDAIVVTNYLHRPLLPAIAQALVAQGVLIYETFAIGQEAFGRPRSPQFLLRPGELLDAFKGLQVVGYEDGVVLRPQQARVQRMVAIGPPANHTAAAATGVAIR